MKLIEQAIQHRVSTAVGVMLILLFGAISLLRIPVQLTPTVEEPVITVTTVWPGASPQEIEREIVDEQEEQLKSLESLRKMESSSQDSVGTITLTFQVGVDKDAALLKVSNRLEQVPAYPDDANKPVISGSNQFAGSIAWFVVTARQDEDGFKGDIATLYDFVEDNIKPEFERVPGVSSSAIFGGREKEMHVIVDPAELAARRVTISELAGALERENRNYSGGDFDEGKRRYIVRTVGEYRTPQEIEQIVIAVRNGVPVYLGDVAQARLEYRKPVAKVYQKGEQMLAINAQKEVGANVLEVMDGLRETVRRLNATLLTERGLELNQVYDETDYIHSAISLVSQSLLIGGTLAIIILLLYLRSFSSTLVIAAAIPISAVGAFLTMWIFGRTLNVISLAGMAFAIGMVVDNSIVVLENIYRHRQMGKSRHEAALHGTREVWGAVLASTLTTIAVFVPVVFTPGEAGQLFGDIAVAISCAVGLSLIVAITVIPSLSSKMLGGVSNSDRSSFRRLWGGVELAARVNRGVGDLVYWITGSTVRKLAVVVVLTLASIGLTLGLMPKREYLPTGNQNFVFGILLPPSGYSLEEVASTQQVFADELRDLWELPADDPRAATVPGGGLRNSFFVALTNTAFMGARSNDDLRAKELIPEFQRAASNIPGAIFIMSQASIFERGLSAGRSIDVEITGPDLRELLRLGLNVFLQVPQVIEGAQAQPIPSLELGNPEIQIRTHRRRAAELGLSNRELGYAVSALVDGVKASDYQYLGEEIDLVIKADESYARRTHLLEQMPIATPDGRLVTLGSVADIELTEGPVQINHVERERTITIRVIPAETMNLETAMQVIETDILEPMTTSGELGGLYRAKLSGTADKLTVTLNAVKWTFLLAVIITYLLMAALFESFLYPFVIMFSVPLAALGGILGLAVMNLFRYQSMDILTMLGFVILLGTVVNNAILIVHQSLNQMRAGSSSPREAIRDAVRTRIRPIFMSVSTSVFGMLPLVVFGGAGSEIYRGLGSVVVGGLIVSTIFTLLLVPAMFSLSLDARRWLADRLRRLVREPA